MASDGKWWQWFETTPEMVISIIITMASLPCSLLARPERCPAPCSPGHLEKATNRVMLSPENSSPNKYPWFSLGLFVFFFTPEVTVPGFKGPRVCFFGGKKNGIFGRHLNCSTRWFHQEHQKHPTSRPLHYEGLRHVTVFVAADASWEEQNPNETCLGSFPFPLGNISTIMKDVRNFHCYVK